jgi:hypothetical protein
MNNANELDPDFINNLDNISLTETDGLSTDGKLNEHLEYVKTNEYTLKRTFAKYIEFDREDGEEDLIFAIQDSENIDWSEISMMPKLPEFIMKEFQDKINWNLVFFNRRMISKTIECFEKQLFSVTNHGDFISKLNDSNTNVLNIILITNKKLIPAIFSHACTNNCIKWVSVLVKNPDIDSNNISNGFKIACQNNYEAIVKILVDHPAITPAGILNGFALACQNNYEAIAKILIDNPAITPAAIMNGFDAARYYSHEAIIKILINNPAITPAGISNGFNAACRNNWESIIENLIDHPAITPADISNGFKAACRNNWESIFKILIDNPAITPADISNGFKIAFQNNFETIVKILSDNPVIKSYVNSPEIVVEYVGYCKNGGIVFDPKTEDQSLIDKRFASFLSHYKIKEYNYKHKCFVYEKK